MTAQRAPLYLPKPRDPLQSANDEVDLYRASLRPPEPNKCPECRASFQGGRWTWAAAPKDSYEVVCPACQRTQDRFPAGFIMVKKGEFLTQTRDELVKFVKAFEKKEKALRPLQRLMDIEDVREGLQITTTDSLLARGIAEALHEEYKGDLKLRYSRDENLLRATWKR